MRETTRGSADTAVGSAGLAAVEFDSSGMSGLMADVATMHANARALLQQADSERPARLRDHGAMLPVMIARLARATRPIADDRAAWDATLDPLRDDARVLPDLAATACDSAR